MSQTQILSLIICIYIASCFICKHFFEKMFTKVPGMKEYKEQNLAVEVVFYWIPLTPILNSGIVIFMLIFEIKYFFKSLYKKPDDTPKQ